MKYIKKFEAKYGEVKEGEYVILNLDRDSDYKLKFHDFLENNIGYVTKTDYYNSYIKYENIPDYLKSYFRDKNYIICDIRHIDKHSFDKQELEAYLAAQKYNL